MQSPAARDPRGGVVVGRARLQCSPDGAVLAVTSRSVKNLGVRRRRKDTGTHPIEPPALFGRDEEMASCLSALESGLAVGIVGEPGVGKTALLRNLAQRLPHHSGPLIALSGRHATVEDLLQQVFEAVYETDLAVQLDDGQRDQYLRGLRAVVILDDVELAREDVQVLLDSAPRCLFVLASEHDLLWGEGRTVTLAGLSEEAALALIEQQLGRPLLPDEEQPARIMSGALRGHPLHLIQLAALVREEGRSLATIAERIQPDMAQETLSQQIVDTLTERERRMLGVLAGLNGAFIDADLVAMVTGLAAPTPSLNVLVRRGLAHTDGHRYRAAEPPAPPLKSALDPEWWSELMLEHLTRWAEAAKDDHHRLLEEVDALMWALQWGTAQGRWSFIERLARTLEPAVALAPRWGAWEQVLQAGLQGARALGDDATEALFLHQLGTRDLALGNALGAQGDLNQALSLRQSLHDERAEEATRKNLVMLTATPGAASRPRSSPASPAHARRKPLIPLVIKVLAITLALVVPASLFLLRSAPAKGLTIDPTKVSFGSRTIGTLSQQNITVKNEESKPIALAVTETPALADFDVISEACTKRALAGGSACNIGVTFTPKATGGRTEMLNVREKTGTSIWSVRVEGAGLPPAFGPAVQLSHSSLNFGEVAVGGAKSQSLTLTNSGNGPLKVNSVMTKPHLSDYVIANSCRGRALPPHGHCSITITFKPTVPGPQPTQLVIGDNTIASPQMVPLTGTGRATGPIVALTRGTLDFGRVEVGQTSVAQTVSVRNSGSGPLVIQSIFLGGSAPREFGPPGVCGRTPVRIEPGRSCAISITFHPMSAMTRTASLTITDNGPGSPHSVALSGTGIPPAGQAGVSLSRSSLDFGQRTIGTRTSLSATVRNIGTQALKVKGVSLSPPGSPFFLGSGCHQVAPGGSCSVTVTFAPKRAGTFSSGVLINDNAPGSPQGLSVIGSSVPLPPPPPAPGASLTPLSLPFGNVPVGKTSEQLVTLTSTGQAALKIGGLSIGQPGNEFSIDPNASTCKAGLQLPPGSSCVIFVLFAPLSPGSFSGTLQVTDNAPSSPESAILTGTGTPPPSP